MAEDDQNQRPDEVVVREEEIGFEVGRTPDDDLIDPTVQDRGPLSTPSPPKKPPGPRKVENLMDEAEEKERKEEEEERRTRERGFLHKRVINWYQNEVNWLDDNWTFSRNAIIVLFLLGLGTGMYFLLRPADTFPCGSDGQFASQGVVYQIKGATTGADGTCINAATGDIISRRRLTR